MGRIASVVLDPASVAPRSPEADRECRVAIADLVHENQFAPAARVEGPFHLLIASEDNRLRFELRDEIDWPLASFTLPVTPFRKVIRDYYMICDSYYEAVESASRARIEALDMSRRAVHNEGSALLRQRLEPHAEVDEATARRLFTLVCALHWR